MRDDLARAVLSLGMAVLVPLIVVVVTRLAKRVWPDPDVTDAQAQIAALKAELVAVREDSRELDRKIGTTRQRAALAMGKHKDAFGSWKAGEN
jgi:uncharacterized protein YpuA (DUF1002 family)